ncbi:MAG: hypothetical protein COA99_10025 [Moraxellaceae bacterium]|nr:MAG: hypothetical protein COA99_10025 [Moraxellaceae bacterium]
MTKTTSEIGTLRTALIKQTQHRFHGAALIDDLGNETPITESMIQQACNTLTVSWKYPTIQQQSVI